MFEQLMKTLCAIITELAVINILGSRSWMEPAGELSRFYYESNMGFNQVYPSTTE